MLRLSRTFRACSKKTSGQWGWTVRSNHPIRWTTKTGTDCYAWKKDNTTLTYKSHTSCENEGSLRTQAYVVGKPPLQKPVLVWECKAMNQLPGTSRYHMFEVTSYLLTSSEHCLHLPSPPCPSHWSPWRRRRGHVLSLGSSRTSHGWRSSQKLGKLHIRYVAQNERVWKHLESRS